MSIQKEIRDWELELAEYGQLHNEDCCVNFEDSRACDVDTGIVDCCDNMRIIARFIAEEKERSRQEENELWLAEC